MSRDAAIRRSGGRCEAMVNVSTTLDGKEVWARCWDRPVEVHHALTRARGGAILDAVGEDYHLISLCRRHHGGADGKDAYEGGLLIDGYVSVVNGRVVYYGTDEYLRGKYGEQSGETGQGEGSADHDAPREVDEDSRLPEAVV